MPRQSCQKRKQQSRSFVNGPTASSRRPIFVPDESIALEVGDRELVESALAACCQDDLTDVSPRVAMAIRYSLLSQGKRFRGLLVLASYRAAGGN